MNPRVCAIIITWNSGRDIYRSLPAIAPQVEKVVVVDNGSRPEELAIVKKLAGGFSNALVIQNQKNEGIARAMNRGGAYASQNGFEWMMTLDDNGKAEAGMVQKMLAVYRALPLEDQEKIAIIAPNYTTAKGLVYKKTKPHFIDTTITSGQLVKVAVWKAVGGYKDDFFITCVDHEFCFRALREGYRTLLVPSAILEEAVGPHPVIHSLLGKKFIVPHYSPDRYYYMYRNSLYLYKTYWRCAPKWISKNILANAASGVKILLFERERGKKVRKIIRGCCDGLKNKFGELMKS